MKVVCYNNQRNLPIDRRSLQTLVEIVLLCEGHSCSQVIVHFVTKKKIQKLHRDYFDDPTSTDVISFPIDPHNSCSPSILGEIFVCPRTAIEYADEKGKDPYLECALYVIHGILHCLGYDDIDPKDRAKMRCAEKRSLLAWEKERLSLKREKTQ